MKILIIHGPQLSLLGKVSSHNKSQLTLDKLNKSIRKYAEDKSVELKIFHHFDRKSCLKTIISNRNSVDGVIFNLGGMTRDFYDMKEILAITEIPVVEVMIEDFPFAKENFEHSALKEVAGKRIFGKGIDIYEKAIAFFAQK